ncbi:hypothetical protein EVG20_g6433 [Dentipellis fragilis]|uniref:Uncharacterized protein n=1 Tax=Dentipellis fragilis TaxID=205917 RepID=A0A4Y9YM03_9AGAM|nr:hypothetical protein EVG20_g6433 [Dentipellis fragilis]
MLDRGLESRRVILVYNIAFAALTTFDVSWLQDDLFHSSSEAREAAASKPFIPRVDSSSADSRCPFLQPPHGAHIALVAKSVFSLKLCHQQVA